MNSLSVAIPSNKYSKMEVVLPRLRLVSALKKKIHCSLPLNSKLHMFFIELYAHPKANTIRGYGHYTLIYASINTFCLWNSLSLPIY
jgi:hypothetical protein